MVPIKMPGSCKGTTASPAASPSPHVAPGTSVTWASEPPSSGPHFPVWAAFREYSAPGVPRGYYVHDLEHGAVVLLYNCALVAGGTAGCDEVVESLRNVVAKIPNDPLCTSPVRVRFVLTPDPLLQRAVAAVAWGQTYVADCVDETEMGAFVTAHYGQGPESFCTDGTTSF